MKNLILALALMLSISTTTNSSQSEEALATYQVYNVEESAMNQIAEKFEVIRKLPNGFEVIVPLEKASELTALAPQHKLIFKNQFQSSQKSVFSIRSILGGKQYQKYPQIVEKLQRLAQERPDFVQFVEYGKSHDGNTLFAVKISDNVTADENEPELMITAATHGDEIITTEVVLGLMDKLVNGYGTDARLTKMVDEHELYFIPVVNADGFIRRARYDQGYDPNRSYPYPEVPNARPTTSIAELIKFFQSRNFVGSIDFHAYGELTMYPWAYTYDSVPKDDQKVFDNLARKMAAANNYTYGPISKVIYVAKGSSADYYYWTKRTIAMAIEVGSEKAPYPDEIDSYTNEQTESTWLFIENF